MQGKIVRSLSGFYDVHNGKDLFRCKAKGVFRALKIKPLVGDDAEIEIVDENAVPMEGNVVRILPRHSTLIRPNVANVDQALLVFAIKHPVPSYNMLDRFLISVRERSLPAVLCFSKADLAGPGEIDELKKIYGGCGAEILFTSDRDEETLEKLRSLLKNRTTVFAGPSGVGKSSLINRLCPDAAMATGELSEKIERGKNTTRHIELFPVAGEESSYVMDTPGFTSLFLEETAAEELKDYYTEFSEFAPKCRFSGCMHAEEPGCAVKNAVQSGEISKIRYDNYRELYSELKDRKVIYRKKNS